MSDYLPLLLLATVVGFLIGATGIGGVLLPPGLMHLQGLAVHEAMALAMVAFAGPGLMAWLSHRATLRTSRSLMLAAVPGAIAGTWALGLLAEGVALMVLTTVLAISAIRLLRSPRKATTPGQQGTAPPRSNGPIGLVTGFSSALTATSGPLVLLPLLLWQGSSLLSAITLGQLIQLPIALAVTASHLVQQEVPWFTGLLLAAMLIPGVIAGQRFGRHLRPRLLTFLVAFLLLGTAAALGFRLLTS